MKNKRTIFVDFGENSINIPTELEFRTALYKALYKESGKEPEIKRYLRKQKLERIFRK